MNKHCITCLYWRPYTGAIRGQCTAVKVVNFENEGSDAFKPAVIHGIAGNSNPPAYLMTHSDFSCDSWKNRFTSHA